MTLSSRLVRLVGSLLMTVSVAFAADQKPAPRPNIIFILADDLGYGDVRCLNPDGKIPTPHLDRLAQEGMTFTEAHSSSAVCTPSRYSILTGRYAWRSTLKSGVLGGFSEPLIEENRLTVAALLRENGYSTNIIGKWHLGLGWGFTGEKLNFDKNENTALNVDFTQPIRRGPTTLGFDYFYGIAASLDMPPYLYIQNDRVTVQPTKTGALPWSINNPDHKKTRVGPVAEGFIGEDVLPTLGKKSVELIDRSAAAAKAGTPFFLYLPLTSPHTPLLATKEWQGKSGINDYADFVMHTDAIVGEVLAALERNGLSENTLVVFTSDNGCSPAADYDTLNAAGHDPSAMRRGYKADIYDGGHRVPLIVKWPAHVKAGGVNHDIVMLGDFMATAAELIGARIPETAAEDSVSYLHALTGAGTGAARDSIILHSINGSFCIREGKWKLEFCPDSGGWSYPRPGRDKVEGLPRWQLFDLNADPAEKTNLVAQQPDVVQRLGKKLREQIISGRSTPGAKQPQAQPKHWKQLDWAAEFAP